MSANGDSPESAEQPPQPPGGDGAAEAVAPSDAAPKPGDGPKPEQLELLFRQIRELADYVLYYVMAKTDRLKLTARMVVFRGVLAVLAYIAVVAVVVMASRLLLDGMVGAFGALCGDRLWAGQLITGVVVLGGLGIAASIWLARQAKFSRERTVEKYEERQERQRARFDHDVSERAGAAAGPSE